MRKLLAALSVFSFILVLTSCEPEAFSPTDTIPIESEVIYTDIGELYGDIVDTYDLSDEYSSETAFGYTILFRREADGTYSFDFGETQEYPAKEIGIEKANDCKAPNGTTYKHCKTFKGFGSELKLVKWIKKTFGDCTCTDTYTVNNANGTTVYGSCDTTSPGCS